MTRYAAIFSASAQRPQSRQCDAKIFPAIRLASVVGLFITETPSGIASASRIGPTNLREHHAGECRARAAVKNALHKSCDVITGTAHPENVILSIVSPAQYPGLYNAATVNSAHHGQPMLVKNPFQNVRAGRA